MKFKIPIIWKSYPIFPLLPPCCSYVYQVLLKHPQISWHQEMCRQHYQQKLYEVFLHCFVPNVNTLAEGRCNTRSCSYSNKVTSLQFRCGNRYCSSTNWLYSIDVKDTHYLLFICIYIQGLDWYYDTM